MGIVNDMMGELGGMFTGVQDYKQGKAMRNLERKNINFSSSMYDQLWNLMKDPSSITESPMYKAGLESVQRTMASQGLTGSGNAMMALSDYGANYYQQQVAMLAQLARGGTPAYGTGSQMQGGGAGLLSSLGAMGKMGDMLGKLGGAGGGGMAGGGVNASAGDASVAAMA